MIAINSNLSILRHSVFSNLPKKMRMNSDPQPGQLDPSVITSSQLTLITRGKATDDSGKQPDYVDPTVRREDLIQKPPTKSAHPC